MSKPTPEEVAELINAEMKRSEKFALTMRWPDFYALTERERVTTPFLENLAQALHRESILMAKGVAVVVFAADYHFAPHSIPAGVVVKKSESAPAAGFR